jgi:hypothetical protein
MHKKHFPTDYKADCVQCERKMSKWLEDTISNLDIELENKRSKRNG